MSATALFATGGIVSLVLVGTTSLTAGAVWPSLRRATAGATPTLRARVALAAALAPWASPLLALLMCLLPGLMAAALLLPDHCPTHADHAHVCIIHPTAALLPLLAGLGSVPAVGLAAAAGVAAARRLRLRRQLAMLHLSRVRLGEFAVSVVDSEHPLSAAAGFGPAQILLSTGLLRSLSQDALQIVLAHERAHVRRHDNLRQVIAQVLSRLHVPARRTEILAELTLASEQVCDEEAAQRVGDRLAVAETILAVERMLQDTKLHLATGLASFGGSTIPARVRALVDGPPLKRISARARWAALVALATVLALSAPLHHAAEHCLAHLQELFQDSSSVERVGHGLRFSEVARWHGSDRHGALPDADAEALADRTASPQATFRSAQMGVSNTR